MLIRWLLACHRGERGQVLILFVAVFTVFLVIAAVVIDFGLWFSERRDVQRAADFAALAGAQDLLVPGGDPEGKAREWATKNGADPSEVDVELLCRNDFGICPDAISVTISRAAPHLFTQLFLDDQVTVTSGAAAVAGLDLDVQRLDTIIARDVSGSMLSGCNAERNNDGCPLKESRDAAHDFVDMLTDADGSSSQVGYIPYNYCYSPPGGYRCIPEADVVPLTTDADSLHTAIDQPERPYYTNICLPLLRANQMLAGPSAQPGPGVQRAVVLLTDGDNNYSTAIADIGGGRPPAQCYPNGTAQPPPNGCQPAWDAERDLDVKTYQRAQELTAQGVEIYVVGLAVCGSDDGHTRGDPGYCAGIGDSAHDNVANQRLLKCVASDPEHYLPVATASELPAIFRLVAGRIAGRGLLR